MKHITKNLGGRPPQYAKPEDLQVAVDSYFASINGGTPTVMGLALACDLSYQGLMQYSQRDGFDGIVNKAKTRIVVGLEEDLVNGTNNPTGKIFWLKCQAKWDDGYSRGGVDRQLNITGNTIVLLPGSLDSLHQEDRILDAVYEQASLTSGQKDPEEGDDGPA